MTAKNKAFVWAFIILAAAIAMNIYGLSNAASFGVVSGLTGAAWGSIYSESGCTKGCLQ